MRKHHVKQHSQSEIKAVKTNIEIYLHADVNNINLESSRLGVSSHRKKYVHACYPI